VIFSQNKSLHNLNSLTFYLVNYLNVQEVGVFLNKEWIYNVPFDELYREKVIISGNIVEIYRHEKPILIGTSRDTSSFRHTKTEVEETHVIDYESGEIIREKTSEEMFNSLKDKLDSRARSNITARNNLRRLALMNFDNKSKFITLTYKDNVTDLEESNGEFKKFIKRLNYYLKKEGKESVQYLTVIEFQKRGAIHYHMICNLNYIKAETLSKLWRHGFVKINRITHVDNIGAYVVKYMTKEDADVRLIGKKMYQCSKGLRKPVEITGREATKIIFELKNKKVAYSSSYKNKLLDSFITYQEINLDRQ
jgi:hypothetical protein